MFERVIMHLDPAHVSENLEDQAAEHGAGKIPCSPAKTEDKLEGKTEGEDGKVDDVSSERGYVLDLGDGERACVDGAEVAVQEECLVEAGVDEGG